ncbi:MAG: winged helix-turn-helix domain-containing protein [Pseudomonadota bacterium]
MSALSHPRRVAILDALAASTASGMTFRDLQHVTRLSASTLNHHLDPMQAAGLVARRLRGKVAVFSADCKALSDAVSHIETCRRAMALSDRALRRAPSAIAAQCGAGSSHLGAERPAPGRAQ